ncbi:hypothetical protein ZHAS_00015001 [Anopheles sinensis]|uniref:Uncharacterized protein n=1 Tax=Anopheles sinensis TaxID=74873 RepID=A0A084W9U7_ANOSI|nr:hypothetical protein ZHAS_00015001 [Anopheles sinensis]
MSRIENVTGVAANGRYTHDDGFQSGVTFKEPQHNFSTVATGSVRIELSRGRSDTVRVNSGSG